MVRVAQITGATRGIGAATALVLAEHGYRVVVNHRASAPHAEVVVATIAAAGGEAAAKSPRATQRNISRKGTNDGREHGEAEGQGHVAREQTAHGARYRQLYNRFQDPFQRDALPAGGNREGRRLDLSDSAQGSQCEAPLARHDVG